MKYRDLIRAAIEDEMKNDHNVICYGLGVTDPKGYLEQRSICISSLAVKEYLICQHQKMQ